MRLFAMPAFIATITLAALVAGLVADGAADALSWLGLGFCLAVIAWALRRR